MFAATAPELEGRGGLYLEDCHVARVNDTPDALDGVKSYAVDVQNAERLWDVDALMPGPTDDESGSVRVICANPPQPTLTRSVPPPVAGTTYASGCWSITPDVQRTLTLVSH